MIYDKSCFKYSILVEFICIFFIFLNRLNKYSLNIFFSKFQDVDVHVGLDHPIYRKSPFTQQSRGCGQSGDHISMPYHFFTDWNTTMEVFGENPAKTFVHEWSKYRYGVFDEYGYPGDKLYPHYYKVQNEIVPTGSTDVKIQGSWKTLDSAQLDCDPSQSEKMNNNSCILNM